MVETRSEMFTLGWRPYGSCDNESFVADSERVYQAACPRCHTPHALHLEYWSKPGQLDKAFTVCRECGLRRAF